MTTMTTMTTISEDRAHVDIADESIRCVNPVDTFQSISLVTRAVHLEVLRVVLVGHLAAGAEEASAEAVQLAVGDNQHHNNTYTHGR